MNAISHVVSPEEIMSMLDGELSASEAQKVLAHIERCAECSTIAEEFRRTSLTLSRWSVEAVPQRLEVEIKNAAAGAKPGRRVTKAGSSASFWNWKPWVMATGVAAVLAVAVRVVTFPHSALPSAVRLASMDSFNGALPSPLAMQKRKEQRSSTTSFVSATSRIAGTAVDTLEEKAVAAPAPAPAPMIARSASLAIRVRDVDSSRSALDVVLARHGGYSAQLNVSRPENVSHTLQASLRIPAGELAAAIGDLKSLGSVENESQSGEEVTQQHTDLVARLKTARETEERLRGILQQRTGKISDVLEVEQEIARVRGEIESMEAEQKSLEHRVDFASVELQLSEVFKAPLNSPGDSVAARVHNAFVAGYQNAKETLLGFLLFFEEYGPALMIWIVILGLPVVLFWRRYRTMRSRV